MTPYEHCTSVRVLHHGLFQPLGEILLERGVFDYWNLKRVVKAQHALARALGDTFDLLNITDLKAGTLAVKLLDQQCHQHRPLGVGVYRAGGAALKRCQEQRCAGRRFQTQGLANVFSRLGRILGRGPGEDKHVFWLDQFLLNARGSYVDMFILSNTGAASSSGDPALDTESVCLALQFIACPMSCLTESVELSA